MTLQVVVQESLEIKMYKKIFIDPDIFIDTNDKTRDTYENSLQTLYYLIENSIYIYTSCNLIKTIYDILAKKDRENAILSIQNINKFAKIVELSNLEVTKACKMLKEDKNYSDLDNTIQYLLAKKEKCKLILSNNSEFYSSDIKVISAKKFCKDMIE